MATPPQESALLSCKGVCAPSPAAISRSGRADEKAHPSPSEAQGGLVQEPPNRISTCLTRVLGNSLPLELGRRSLQQGTNCPLPLGSKARVAGTQEHGAPHLPWPQAGCPSGAFSHCQPGRTPEPHGHIRRGSRCEPGNALPPYKTQQGMRPHAPHFTDEEMGAWRG